MKHTFIAIISFIFFSTYSNFAIAQDTSAVKFTILSDSMLINSNVEQASYYVSRAIEVLDSEGGNVDSDLRFRSDFYKQILQPKKDSIYYQKLKDYLLDYPIENLERVPYNLFLNCYIELIRYSGMSTEEQGTCVEEFKQRSKMYPTDITGQIYIHNNSSSILFDLGRKEESFEDSKKVMELIRIKDDLIPWHKGVFYYNYYYAQSSMGNYKEYLKYLILTEELLSANPDPNYDYLISTIYDLSYELSKEGEYEKAELLLLKVENLLKEHGKEIFGEDKLKEKKRKIHLLYRKSDVYAAKGDIDKLKSLNGGLREFRNETDYYFKLRRAAVFNNIGEGLVDDFPNEAISYYQKALNSVSKLEYVMQYQFNMAKGLLGASRNAEALRLIEEVLEKAIPRNDRRLPYFYTMKGNLLLESGLFDEGVTFYNRAINKTLKNGSIDINDINSVDSADLSENIFHAYLMNNIAENLKDLYPEKIASIQYQNFLYNLGIKLFENNYLGGTLTSKSNEEYEKMLHGYLRTSEILDREVDYARLIKLSENANSRILWESFKSSNKDLELVDSELLLKERSKRNKITELKQVEDQNKKIELAIFELEKDLEEIEKKKQTEYKAYFSFEDFDFDVEEFQSTVGDRDLFIKYEFLDSNLYVYIITNNDIEGRLIGESEMILPKIEKLVTQVSDYTRPLDSLQWMASESYKVLFPFDIPKGVRNLTIEADGILNYLPFDILMKDERYLLEDYNISNTTSLAISNYSKGNNEVNKAGIFAPSYNNYTQGPQLIAMRGEAYNLEGALMEGDEISKLVPSDLYYKELATKSAFKEKAQDYDILHLSMHSFIHDRDPELTSLVFNDEDDDKELYMSELYGMNLKAKLAVLSACNTGVGEMTDGSGIVSMNRAFMYAGVPSVISSLWNAPDKATQQVMTSFYKELKSGKSKSEALRYAKLDYLKNQTVQQFQHPFFWAGFILQGENESLEFQDASPWRLLVLILFLVILFGAIGRWQLNARKLDEEHYSEEEPT